MADGFFARFRKVGKFFSPEALISRVHDGVADALERTAAPLVTELERTSPVGVYGRLRDSWATRVDVRALQVVVVNVAPYFLAVELGRRAAWVPIAPLKLWVEVKLGIPDPFSKRVAYAISYKKSRVPTPGQFNATKTWEQNRSRINFLMRSRVSLQLRREIV